MTDVRKYFFNIESELPSIDLYLSLNTIYSQKIIFTGDSVKLVLNPINLCDFSILYNSSKEVIDKIINLYEKIYFNKFNEFLNLNRASAFNSLREYSNTSDRDTSKCCG